jgi:photosystem II stability/assembly factor-like uncharacterized protein
METNLEYWGARDAVFHEQLLRIAQSEATRSIEGSKPAAGASTPIWVNLGPADSRFEQRRSDVNSGRLRSVLLDPRSSDLAYVASAGGGVWKTFNLTARDPTWIPLTDSLGNLSVGALAMDPGDPETLYLGLGDPFEVTAGGALFKSTDGGESWTMLASRLQGRYPRQAGGRVETAVTVRDLKIDPNDSKTILVATEVGLFRSTDGGYSFYLASLPTTPDGIVQVESSAWSIAYLGAARGASHWLVSGVYACAPGQHPPVRPLQIGLPPGPSCPGGNRGDLWRSTDGGRHWQSLRSAGVLKLPFTTPDPAHPELADVGRMALAVGWEPPRFGRAQDSRPRRPGSPANAVVYIQAGAINDLRNVAILKSVDGGSSFIIAADDVTPVLNPTRRGPPPLMLPPDCADMNVAHGFDWYNLAIAVNPQDSDQVLIAGNFCAVRSLDGGLTWENISHWDPDSGMGDTEEGPLLYVHADWHGITFATVADETVVFAATDGGVFRATNPLTARPPDVNWRHANRSLVTHQFYSIASGETADGEEYIVFGGAQDNGTYFRDLDPEADPRTFNVVLGGDGSGAVVTHVLEGERARTLYFISAPLARVYCLPGEATDCDSVSPVGWRLLQPLWLRFPGDFEPSLTRYATIRDEPGAVLTTTNSNVVRLFYPRNPPQPPQDAFSKNPITPWHPNETPRGVFPPGTVTRNIRASQRIYQDEKSTPFRLYGVVLTDGLVSVGIDQNVYPTETADTLDRSDGVTWRNAPTPVGVGPSPDQRQSFATSIAFPADASHFGGADGEVFFVSTTAPKMADELTLVPDGIGHLFLTADGGQTWRPMGTIGAKRLPNVPIQMIQFDPNDSSDQTVYVGSDIGVYRSSDGGESWERFGVGLPLARVTEMHIARDGLIRVSTYGRGIWEIRPGL